MDFATAVSKAYETKWDYINSFTVDISFADNVAKAIGWTVEDKRNINLNIISIDTPQFSNQPIEVYVGDRWKIHNGRDELYRFSITFRDQDQLTLYRKFVKAYLMQRTEYFDYTKLQIILSKDDDYITSESNRRNLFDFQDTMIDNVSQIQFNNTTETQIVEFSVTFKCATPILQ
jgi:hypothetical protein